MGQQFATKQELLKHYADLVGVHEKLGLKGMPPYRVFGFPPDDFALALDTLPLSAWELPVAYCEEEYVWPGQILHDLLGQQWTAQEDGSFKNTKGLIIRPRMRILTGFMFWKNPYADNADATAPITQFTTREELCTEYARLSRVHGVLVPWRVWLPSYAGYGVIMFGKPVFRAPAQHYLLPTDYSNGEWIWPTVAQELRRPLKKKITVLGYLNTAGRLTYAVLDSDMHKYAVRHKWTRVPAEDKAIEVDE